MCQCVLAVNFFVCLSRIGFHNYFFFLLLFVGSVEESFCNFFDIKLKISLNRDLKTLEIISINQ